MFKWHVMYVLAELFQFLCDCKLLLRRKLDYKFSVKHVNPFSVLSMLARKAYLSARKDYFVFSALQVRLFVLPVQIWDLVFSAICLIYLSPFNQIYIYIYIIWISTLQNVENKKVKETVRALI